MNRLTRRAALGAAAAFTIAPSARAQVFSRQADALSRALSGRRHRRHRDALLADPMQVDLGQPVVVEPKPGGNSTLATAMIPGNQGRS